MFAVIAAVLFGLALILDLAGMTSGTPITGSALVTAGLLCMALHLAGFGNSGRGWDLRRLRSSMRR
jgi:hypothetical protein